MIELHMQQSELCDIQGRFFEMALKNGYDCKEFIERFMNSKTAADLYRTYDRLQWAGEEYILEELNEEVGGFKKVGNTYPTRLCIGQATPTAIGSIIPAKAVKRFMPLLPPKPWQPYISVFTP